MTYNQAISYLNSFVDYEKKPVLRKLTFSLSRIGVLIELFNNPQHQYPGIHIAGTKGKGSVSAILSGILREAGFKTGLYTSPHISSIRERIKINGRNISKDDFIRLCSRIKDILSKSGLGIQPSFFEIYTLIAFEYFKRKKVDIAVFETGMGGRLDATNVIKPIVTAITSIGSDHTKELGFSLERIAGEKAGIIKKDVPCILARQKDEVKKVVKDKCRKMNCEVFVIGKDLSYKSLVYSDRKEMFTVKGLLGKYGNLTLPLLGEHQLENCSVSIGIAEILIKKGYKISKRAIQKGVARVKWPGRCEIIKRRPYLILDSAHNSSSARALKKTIKRNFDYKNVILILGILRDKDIKGICNELTSLAGKIILTKINSPRTQTPEYIKKFIKRKNVTITQNIREAYKISKDLAGTDDIILVTGSIYLIGEFKRFMRI